MKLIANSKSTMTKIKHMNKYPLTPMKMTMHPERDDLYALYDKLKCFPHRPTFESVPSHQDDNDEISLSISTQLNVYSDELGSECLQQLVPKFHLPFDLIAKVQLHHVGRTITID